MLINIQTQQTIGEYQFRLLHPDTSFPAELADSILTDFGHATLTYPAAPTAAQGKKIVDGGVEQIDGKWFAKYVEVDLSQDEIADFAAAVRADRNQRLAQSDWTQVADVPVNKAAWAAYRQDLRDVTLQPGFPFNVNWPVAPA